LARRVYPELVKSPVWAPLPKKDRVRVEAFVGDYGARIDADGAPDDARSGRIGDGEGINRVVESTVPLRSSVGTGSPRLVDLELADEGDAFAPRNPLVTTRLGKRPTEAVAFPESGVTIGVGRGRLAEGPALVHDRVVHANVDTDSDLLVAPMPRGVQMTWQIRSVASPEEATLILDLPPRATLRMADDRARGVEGARPSGTAEVVRDGEPIARFLPPAALDAGGAAVAGVSYSVEGHRLVVHFPHRSQDLLYPLMVDPTVEHWRRNGGGDWVMGSEGDKGAWYFASNQPSGHFWDWSQYYCCQGGLGMQMHGGYTTWYPDGSWGEWIWVAPRQSMITRAEYDGVYHSPAGHHPEGDCLSLGIYSFARWDWEWGSRRFHRYEGDRWNEYWGASPWYGHTRDDWGWYDGQTNTCWSLWNSYSEHFPGTQRGGPTPGWPAFVFMLQAHGQGSRANQAHAYLHAATIELDDRTLPRLTSNSVGASGWLREGQTASHTTAAIDGPTDNVDDAGLGMAGIQLLVPREGGGEGSHISWVTCDRGRISRCPPTHGATFSYPVDDVDPDTAGSQPMPEGVNHVTVNPFDVLWKTLNPAPTAQVKVDRSPPSALNASGALYQPAGKWFTEGTHHLTLQPTDAHSGVRSSEIQMKPGPTGIDRFARAATGGWGTADLGGSWSVMGDASRFSVDGSRGRIAAPQDTLLSAVLASSSVRDVDVNAQISFPEPPGFAAQTAWIVLRRQSDGRQYRVGLARDGLTQKLSLVGEPAGALFAATDAGLTYQPGATYNVRARIVGDGSPDHETRVRARIWEAGTREPTTWAVDGIDQASAGPQTAGFVGLAAESRAAGIATFGFDDLVAVDLERFRTASIGDAGCGDQGCNTTLSHEFDWQTAGYPEGAYELRAIAKDPLAYSGGAPERHILMGEPWRVDLDRTPPGITDKGGSLASEGGSMRRGSNNLIVSTSDSPSGVSRIEAFVSDADQPSSPRSSIGSKSCIDPEDGCPVLTGEFQWDSSQSSAERIRVAVEITDQAGNMTSKDWVVSYDANDPVLEVDGTLKQEDTMWVERGDQNLSVDAADSESGVVRAELRIDDNVVEAVDQGCDSGGCPLSHNFIVNTDGHSEGAHTITARALDGANNVAQQSWTARIERKAPTLTVTGTLKVSEGKTLEDGRTYDLAAAGTDAGVTPLQGGIRSITVAVDDEENVVYQACPTGGCPMTRTFEYRPESYESGPRTISVTARDFAGNETTETFTVINPDPPPLQCPDPPDEEREVNPAPVLPEVALLLLQSERGFPQAVVPSTEYDLNGTLLKPGLDSSDLSEFRATRTITPSLVDRIAADGARIRFENAAVPVCISPTKVSLLASDPPPAINGTAALYANSRPATDTVIRPTATGVRTFNQLRTPLAPTELSWHVGLQPGQTLRELANGSIAVVEPAPDGTVSPNEDVPGEPTVAERHQAVADTGLQLRLARSDLERADANTPDDVVAVVPKPWAKDALGRAVPTSLGVSGSTLTLRVEHNALAHEYPVVTDIEAIDAEAVDHAEAEKAAAGIDDYTDAAISNTRTAGGPPSSGPPATLDEEQDVPFPEDGSASWTDDIDESEDEDGPSPTDDPTATLSDAEMSRRLGNIQLGLTESDPATLSDANFQPNPTLEALNPRHLRPIVPYNVVRMVDRPRTTGGCDYKAARRWHDWYERAKRLKPQTDVTIDVAIARDYRRRGSKGSDENCPDGKAPRASTYGRHLKAFLKRYGDIVDTVGAWNEPNFVGDPLYNKPALAGSYWVIANRLCQRFGCRAVAGEYAGRPKDKYRARYRGGRKQYSTIYHESLRGRNPEIWGFHAYGDSRSYAFRYEGRYKAKITRRYYTAFRRSDYKVNGHAPEIWLSAIAFPYHVSCKETLKKKAAQEKYCGKEFDDDTPDELLLIGMRAQRNTAAFILRVLAKEFPAVSRIYPYALQNVVGFDYGAGHSSGRCRPGRTTGTFCPRTDYGLVGSDDDEKHTIRHTLPGAEGRSQPGERRAVFCLLRDRTRRPSPVRLRDPRLQPCD
jgi:hypothetical protein